MADKQTSQAFSQWRFIVVKLAMLIRKDNFMASKRVQKIICLYLVILINAYGALLFQFCANLAQFIWIQRVSVSFLLCKLPAKRPSSSYIYTGCHRRNGPNFGRVFLMLNYTDITQNTYIQSWMVTEIMAREKCGHLAFPRNVRLHL